MLNYAQMHDLNRGSAIEINMNLRYSGTQTYEYSQVPC